MDEEQKHPGLEAEPTSVGARGHGPRKDALKGDLAPDSQVVQVHLGEDAPFFFLNCLRAFC